MNVWRQLAQYERERPFHSFQALSVANSIRGSPVDMTDNILRYICHKY